MIELLLGVAVAVAGFVVVLVIFWLGSYFWHTGKLAAISRFASRSRFKPTTPSKERSRP